MEKVSASRESILGRRIGAFITDHIIICFLCSIPFLWCFNKMMDNPMVYFEYFSAIMVIAVSIYLIKDVIGGRSIGKLLFGLYVKEYKNIDKTPAIHKLILRNLLTFLWPIELIAMIIDKENRKLGVKVKYKGFILLLVAI